MFRLAFLLLLTTTLVTCATNEAPPGTTLSPSRSTAGPPNLLLIVADDLGYADLNCYGSPLAETPHLDRLAREGVQFMHGYVASNNDAESRRALLSGRHPARRGQTDPIGLRTLATLNNYTFSQTSTTDEALRTMLADAKKPWLVTVSYPAPADTLSGTTLWKERYRNLIARTHRRPYPTVGHAARVSALDAQVGRLLEALDRSDQAVETLVFFLSDAGGSLDRTQNGILRGGHGELFEGGLRVPFLLRYPAGGPSTSTVTAPVSALDIVPTFRDALGIRHDKDADGRSLLPYLKGDRLKTRTLVWWRDSVAAIRYGDYKLIHDRQTDSLTYFHLVNYPSETVPADPRRSLRGRLIDWRKRH